MVGPFFFLTVIKGYTMNENLGFCARLKCEYYIKTSRCCIIGPIFQKMIFITIWTLWVLLNIETL